METRQAAKFRIAAIVPWAILLLISFSLFCSRGFAEMSVSLPECSGFLFQSARWEGYQPAVVSGFGNENSSTGQYAVIMKKGDHNVLCIVEKAQGQDEFLITVENDKAVYQGDLLPSLLIDTGGDTLFYSYRKDEGDITSERCHASKFDGQWSTVDVILFHKPQEGRFPETLLSIHDGELRYTMQWADENDNIMEWGEPIQKGLVNTSQYLLPNFDIHLLMSDFLGEHNGQENVQ